MNALLNFSPKSDGRRDAAYWAFPRSALRRAQPAKRRKRRKKKRPILPLLPRKPRRRLAERAHRRKPAAPRNPQLRQNRLPGRSRDRSAIGRISFFGTAALVRVLQRAAPAAARAA